MKRFFLAAAFAAFTLLAGIPTANAAPSFAIYSSTQPASLTIDTTTSSTDFDSSSFSVTVRNSGPDSGSVAAPSSASVSTGVTATCTSGCGTATLSANGGTRTSMYSVSADQTSPGGSHPGSLTFTGSNGWSQTHGFTVSITRRDAGLLYLSVDDSSVLMSCPAQSSTTHYFNLQLSNQGQTTIYIGTVGASQSAVSVSLGSQPYSISAGGIAYMTASFSLPKSYSASSVNIGFTVSYTTTRYRDPSSISQAFSVSIPVEAELLSTASFLAQGNNAYYNLFPEVEVSRSYQKTALIGERCGYLPMSLTVTPLTPNAFASAQPSSAQIPAGSSTMVNFGFLLPAGQSGGGVCKNQSWSYRVSATATIGSGNQFVFNFLATPAFANAKKELQGLDKAVVGLGTAPPLPGLLRAFSGELNRRLSLNEAQCERELADSVRLFGILPPLNYTVDSLNDASALISQGRSADAARIMLANAASLDGVGTRCSYITVDAWKQNCSDIVGQLRGRFQLELGRIQGSVQSEIQNQTDTRKTNHSRLQELHSALALTYRALNNETGATLSQQRAQKHYDWLLENQTHATGRLENVSSEFERRTPISFLAVGSLMVIWNPATYDGFLDYTNFHIAQSNTAAAEFEVAGNNERAREIRASVSAFQEDARISRLVNGGVLVVWALLLLGLTVWTVRRSFAFIGDQKVAALGEILMGGGKT